MLNMILNNSLIRVPLLFAAAVGAVVAIAGGFVTVYKVVTFIGN
jgi:hypothetical protein